MVGISRVGERDPRAGVGQVVNPLVPGEVPDEYPVGPDEQQVPTQCDRLDARDAMLRGHRDFDEFTGAPIEGEEMPGLLGADVQGIPGGSDRAYVLFATQGLTVVGEFAGLGVQGVEAATRVRAEPRNAVLIDCGGPCTLLRRERPEMFDVVRSWDVPVDEIGRASCRERVEVEEGGV